MTPPSDGLLPLYISCDLAVRRRIARHLFFVLLAVAGYVVTVDAFLIEPYRIEVTYSSVQAPLYRPLKIAHLSDLHSSGWVGVSCNCLRYSTPNNRTSL